MRRLLARIVGSASGSGLETFALLLGLHPGLLLQGGLDEDQVLAVPWGLRFDEGSAERLELTVWKRWHTERG